MSEREAFLTRWSRRKREAAAGQHEAAREEAAFPEADAQSSQAPGEIPVPQAEKPAAADKPAAPQSPCIPEQGGTAGSHARGAAPCVEQRSRRPRLHRAFGELVGFHGARRRSGFRAIGAGNCARAARADVQREHAQRFGGCRRSGRRRGRKGRFSTRKFERSGRREAGSIAVPRGTAGRTGNALAIRCSAAISAFSKARSANVTRAQGLGEWTIDRREMAAQTRSA